MNNADDPQVRHDPAFDIQRMIDNGGTFNTGTRKVTRTDSHPHIGSGTVTNDDPFDC